MAFFFPPWGGTYNLAIETEIDVTEDVEVPWSDDLQTVPARWITFSVLATSAEPLLVSWDGGPDGFPLALAPGQSITIPDISVTTLTAKPDGAGTCDFKWVAGAGPVT